MFTKDCWDLILSVSSNPEPIMDVYPFYKTFKKFGIEAFPSLNKPYLIKWLNENVLHHPPASVNGMYFKLLIPEEFLNGIVCERLFSFTKEDDFRGEAVIRSGVGYFHVSYTITPKMTVVYYSTLFQNRTLLSVQKEFR